MVTTRISSLLVLGSVTSSPASWLQLRLTAATVAERPDRLRKIRCGKYAEKLNLTF